MKQRSYMTIGILAAALILLSAASAFAQEQAVVDSDLSEPAESGDKETCCRYVGDINHDGAGGGAPDIVDLVYMVTYMFQEGPCDAMCEDSGVVDCGSLDPPLYFPEADINGDGHQAPLIDDLVWLINYININGPEPVGWIDYNTPACER